MVVVDSIERVPHRELAIDRNEPLVGVAGLLGRAHPKAGEPLPTQLLFVRTPTVRVSHRPLWMLLESRPVFAPEEVDEPCVKFYSPSLTFLQKDGGKVKLVVRFSTSW